MNIEILKRRIISKRFINPFSRPIPFCWEWTGFINKDGYGEIKFHGKTRILHRVIAHIWSDFDLYSDFQMLHKCDNRKCFNPEHLFEGMPRDNMDDKCNKNRQARGETHGFSKLTERQVIEIRNKFKLGINRGELKDEYNVSYSTIQNIISNISWKHQKI